MKAVLIIFMLTMNGSAWSDSGFMFGEKKKASKLSQMKKRFDKRVIGNPLLKMNVKKLSGVITVTRGYCDKRARFNINMCHYHLNAYTRKRDGYRLDDFRDPRVYSRYYRYIKARIRTNPAWGRVEARSYGYQARYIP